MKLTEIRRLPALDSSCCLPLDRPFTAQEAHAEGVSSHLLTALVREGFLRQPVKSVYVASQLEDTTALRCACLRLVVPSDCVVVDRHAAWLLGAPMVLAPNEHISVQPISVFRPSGHGRLRNALSLSGERNLLPRDLTTVSGLQVTTPLRTALDLGRHRFPETALAGVDAMLRLGVDKEELLQEIGRFRGMRWVTTLRLVAPLGDGRSQSPGESVLRLRWIEAGIPEPTPQVEVWIDGRLVAVLDLANEDLRYAAEYDGAEWHSSPEQVRHDRERREQVAGQDWVVDAFVARNVFGARADADRLMRQGVVRARRMLASRPRHFM